MKSQERAAIRSLGMEELNAQLHETEEKLFKLKFANALAPLKNGLEIRNLRKHKARLLTWIHQKKITQIKRSDSPDKVFNLRNQS